jgi:hypothetical protein
MKPTEFIVENSTIAQEADDMHRDHEVQMARSQMYSAAQAAIEIHRLLRDVSEMEGLEGWVQSKLTLASQYLESVRDYMKYEAVSQEPEMMMFAEAAADYAIDQLLVEDDYDDAVKDYFAQGGKVEKLPAKKPRKSEKTDFSSRHISGKGEVGRGKAGRIGKSAKTDPKGKPVVTAEDDESPVRKPGGDYVGPDKGYAASSHREKIMRAEPGEINPMLQKHAERSTPRAYGDPGVPGAKEITGPRGAGVRDFTNKGLPMGGGSSVGVAKPEGVPKVSRMPTTPFGGGGGGGMNPFEKRRSLYFEREEIHPDQSNSPPVDDRSKRTATTKSAERKEVYPDKQELPPVVDKSKKIKENATGGSSSAGGMAISMSGPGHKPTSGVPKKIGNSYKTKRVAVGKGIY